MRDINNRPEPTTSCSECYYFKKIYGVKTCGLHKSFIKTRYIGCHDGYKSRNIEAENYWDGVELN